MVLCDTNIFMEIYKGNDKVIETFKKIGQNNVAISDKDFKFLENFKLYKV